MIAVKIYVVYDTLASQIVGQPMLMHHDAPAIRAFTDAASDPQTMIHRHTKDYDLMCLGEIDDQLNLCSDRRVVINGNTLQTLRERDAQLELDAK